MTIFKQLAMIAGLTAPLLLSGCFIERVSTPTAYYPAAYDDYNYGYGHDHDGDYSASSRSSYGSDYGYTTPSPLPSLAAPAPTNGNHNPIISSMAANPRLAVKAGEAITFSVTAYDRDNDPLQLNWTTTGGMLSADTGRTVSWVAPEQPGVYSVQVLVADDRGGSVTGSLNIKVDERGVAVVPRPADNTPPTVSWTTPEPTPTPRPTGTPRAVSTPFPLATPSPLPEEWTAAEEDWESEEE